MIALRQGFRHVEFAASLMRARRRALMLDYDGTLAPFRVERAEATPYPGIPQALERVNADPATRLIIISGRQAREVEQLLGVRPAPEIWGCHGWERLLPGKREGLVAEIPELTKQALREGAERLYEAGAGTRLERKPASVALHWRGECDAGVADLRRMALDSWGGVASDPGLEIRHFDGGIELRARGRDKGAAVREALAEEPEETVAAYLGDDETDEDAFRAMAGRGLSVLVREAARATAADIWLKPPEDLTAFLLAWPVEPAEEGFR